MLAAELAKHKKGGGGTSGAPPPAPGVGPTFSSPFAMDYGRGDTDFRGAQSLPVHSLLASMGANIPPKPRVRPSPSPSLQTLTELPILELPEASLSPSAPLRVESGRAKSAPWPRL